MKAQTVTIHRVQDNPTDPAQFDTEITFEDDTETGELSLYPSELLPKLLEYIPELREAIEDASVNAPLDRIKKGSL